MRIAALSLWYRAAPPIPTRLLLYIGPQLQSQKCSGKTLKDRVNQLSFSLKGELVQWARTCRRGRQNCGSRSKPGGGGGRKTQHGHGTPQGVSQNCRITVLFPACPGGEHISEVRKGQTRPALRTRQRWDDVDHRSGNIREQATSTGWRDVDKTSVLSLAL